MLSLCLERFLVGFLDMNVLIRNFECHRYLFILRHQGVLKDKRFEIFLIFRVSMCHIPACPVLKDYGVMYR